MLFLTIREPILAVIGLEIVEEGPFVVVIACVSSFPASHAAGPVLTAIEFWRCSANSAVICFIGYGAIYHVMVAGTSIASIPFALSWTVFSEAYAASSP